MNNNELFDSCIKDINNNTQVDIPDDSTNEVVTESTNTVIELSTRENIAIDLSDVNMEDMVEMLPNLIENEKVLNIMTGSLLHISDPNEETAVDCIDDIINQLTEYMDGYGIHPNYEANDPCITKYKKAIFMVIDSKAIVNVLSNIIRSYMKDVEIYNTINNVDIDEKPQAPVYRVTAILNDKTENGFDIISTETTDQYHPDELDIIFYDETNTNKMFVDVCEYTITEAIATATDMFKTELT